MRNPVEIPPDLAPPPSNPTESGDHTVRAENVLAEMLAELLHVEQVPADGNFFHDLGADSLVMAQFCARVRKRTELPRVSMKDVYQHQTVRSLAIALTEAIPAPTGPTEVAPAGGQAPAATTTEPDASAVTPASNRQYILCGALQLLIFLGSSYFAGFLARVGFGWLSTASGFGNTYLRSVVFAFGGFVVACTVPILAKWVLIGRWKPQEIQIWSMAYLRFWFVKTLVRSNPLALFVGTPIYPFYLRALGAKIGKRTAIFSKGAPVCTDLLTIGAGTVVSQQSSIQCYRAHAGRIQIGPVTLGNDVYVGENTVLDINTSMGDGAQLGHSSALHSGQTVPSGQRWHGSPAVRTEVNYARIEPARCSLLRKVGYSSYILLRMFLFLGLGLSVFYLVLTKVPPLAALLGPGLEGLRSPTLGIEVLIISLVLYVVGLPTGLLGLRIVPYLLSFLITPGKAYPLYGFHYAVQRMITGLTNRKFLTYLFGDSSAVVHYLRWLGYDLGRIVQTGVNFGMEMRQDNPHLTAVGSGTMVADGLNVLNTEFSTTSFSMSQVSIGQNNFLGNNIAYPAGGRTGDNCLLATKVMIPIEGKIHEGVGLLGSPCFEIPRSVARDGRFDHLATGDELRRRLARKNRYDVVTMAIFLFVMWLYGFLLLALGVGAVDLFGRYDAAAVAALLVLGPVVTTAYFALVERVMARFRPMQPQYCSVYDPYFWWHERWWKTSHDTHLHAFAGTPFKNLASRLRGVRIGRRVFDDGSTVTEPTLAAIGDDCTLNLGSILQSHSQEDGTFKSDRIVVGAGCTLGPGAHVHYGTTVGDGATLAADSFLMKGEQVPPHAHWGGNPAREITT